MLPNVASGVRRVHDELHQADLGLSKMHLRMLQPIATHFENGAEKMKQMDERLIFIKANCRYSSFRVPGTDKSGYFSFDANYAAFEHRSIMEVVVLCMVGLFPDEIIRCFNKYWDRYILACRSKQHTLSTLQQMDQLMTETIAWFKAHLSPWSGVVAEYSANIYKKCHVPHMKGPYRASNKRDAMKQIVKHNQRLESYRVFRNLDNSRKRLEKVTALDQAVKTGKNVLASKCVHLFKSWLNQDGEPNSALLVLPQGVSALLSHQPELKMHFLAAVKHFEREHELQCGEAFTVYQALAITAGEGDHFANWPMYARSAAEFHKAPWYSSVAVQMEASGEEPVTLYGQIRLLFTCGVEGAHQELACMRMYEELPASSISRLVKCKQLRWVGAVAR